MLINTNNEVSQKLSLILLHLARYPSYLLLRLRHTIVTDILSQYLQPSLTGFKGRMLATCYLVTRYTYPCLHMLLSRMCGSLFRSLQIRFLVCHISMLHEGRRLRVVPGGKMPRGLANPPKINACFMNSALQSMAAFEACFLCPVKSSATHALDTTSTSIREGDIHAIGSQVLAQEAPKIHCWVSGILFITIKHHT